LLTHFFFRKNDRKVRRHEIRDFGIAPFCPSVRVAKTVAYAGELFFNLQY